MLTCDNTAGAVLKLGSLNPKPLNNNSLQTRLNPPCSGGCEENTGRDQPCVVVAGNWKGKCLVNRWKPTCAGGHTSSRSALVVRVRVHVMLPPLLPPSSSSPPQLSSPLPPQKVIFRMQAHLQMQKEVSRVAANAERSKQSRCRAAEI